MNSHPIRYGETMRLMLRSFFLIVCLGVFGTGCTLPSFPTPGPDATATLSGVDCPACLNSTATLLVPGEDTQASVTPTAMPPSGTAFPFVAQSGIPVYLSNFAHPDRGCEWAGIAGQVFDAAGAAKGGLVVSVLGQLDGQPVDGVTLSGLPASQGYGPGGYELVLGDHPVQSQGNLTVQVFDQSGNPLTAPFIVDTFADCERNLVLVNFVGR